MKSDHKSDLIAVCFTVINGVLLSACGNYLAAFWAFVCSGLLICLAAFGDMLEEALTEADEANEGWQRVSDLNAELLKKMDSAKNGPSHTD